MSNVDFPSTLAGPLLQSFFTEHLLSHRRASQQTVDSYRDTFRLLLRFLQQSTGKQPASLRIGDFDERIALGMDNCWPFAPRLCGPLRGPERRF